MPGHDDTDWAALGRRLVRRRVELNPDWSNRRVFAEETLIDYGLSYRLEKGHLRRVEEATKATIEKAYGLAPDSFDEMTATGQPVPDPRLTESGPSQAASSSGDIDLDILWRELGDLRRQVAELRADADRRRNGPERRAG